MSSANFRDMRTRRGFVRECGRATGWALVPALAVLTLAMGLVVVAPPSAAGTATQNFYMKLQLDSVLCNQKSSCTEVLSAFSLSTSATGSVSATATMPVDATSVELVNSVPLQQKMVGFIVDFYHELAGGVLVPVFRYTFGNPDITSYLLQDETGTGASVQITFGCKHLTAEYISTT